MVDSRGQEIGVMSITGRCLWSVLRPWTCLIASEVSKVDMRITRHEAEKDYCLLTSRSCHENGNQTLSDHILELATRVTKL